MYAFYFKVNILRNVSAKLVKTRTGQRMSLQIATRSKNSIFFNCPISSEEWNEL